MKTKIIIGAALASAVLFSGCSATAKTLSGAKSQTDNKDIATVIADKDSTSLGFINIGNVVRKNYKIALGMAAKYTQDNGYMYFSIIAPSQFVELQNERDIKNDDLQGLYSMCDEGDERFHMGISPRNTILDGTKCDHITMPWREATLLGGTVLHRTIKFDIRMSNEPAKHSFDAKKVLASDLLSDIEPELFNYGSKKHRNVQ